MPGETKLRIDEALHRQLMQVARNKGVSLNSEMRARLQASVEQEGGPEERVAEKIKNDVVSPERVAAPPIDDSKTTIAELRAENARKSAEIAQLREIVASRRPSGLSGKLSATRIAKLISDAKAGKLKKRWFGDGNNLWLQISNNGAGVSWIFRYDGRRFGHPGDVPMGLGSYETVDLEQAREVARRYRQLLLDGKDPKAAREEAKVDDLIRRGAARTVNQVIDEYLEAKIAGLKPFTQQQTALWLKRWVRDKIGNWPIQKVNQNTILETCELRNLWMNRNPTAKAFQNHLSRIFDLAIEADYYRGKNPATWKGLQYRLPKSREVHRTKHHDSLPYQDVGRFLEKVRAYKDVRFSFDTRTTVSFAVEFIILSGVRLSEARLARWKEIDLKHRVWNVPPEHLKMGHIHNTARPIPITKSMLGILDEMQRRRRDHSPEAFVFPAMWSRSGALNRANVATFILYQLGWENHLTIHGFRSTLRDWCRAHSYPAEWWDIQVDHSLGNKTSQSYGHSKLIEERRGMMEKWDEYCSKPAPVPTAADVIHIAGKRRFKIK
jgi:integrase